jgi:hypothetical protein
MLREMFSGMVCVTKCQLVVLREATCLFWGLCVVLGTVDVVFITCIEELFSDEIV